MELETYSFKSRNAIHGGLIEMSRPFLDSSVRRRNSVQVYLTDREFRLVCRIALRRNLPISVWLRKILLREVEKESAP